MLTSIHLAHAGACTCHVNDIWFHKTDDGETIKDVTYHGTYGKVHSQKYNDWGILQGSIIWELQGR